MEALKDTFFANRPLTFKNLSDSNLTFEDVYFRIVSFMRQEPMGNYRLMIGTDSHVYSKETVFITGIVIQRVGRGAWACYRKLVYPNPIRNLHQKISIETSLTEQVAFMFNDELKNELIEIVLPHVYKGASLTMEGHLDIGKGQRNKTREFVSEMVARIEAHGIQAKIKPDSLVASSYANRYTK
ncbi:MAG TPA: ribonuclease H-like YkuK family protein [Bacillus sp. (in: firmicutes)]|uniref:ribonuclease H-like YkuK family protein n=1 Tax=Bacillus litorisediminis TaxID=2922713 RepID=UPI001FAD4991|nr:ribonuclease H-like YkuK family protein [Bacillus litorisediminis]HWO77338.1 ribonuclease H-like YkuK family protein [Bacillus sp. (in: firmicutes)]